MEKSKRSEATLTACMNHEDDYVINGDSNLSQTVCVHLNNLNNQGTMTLTDNKEERLRKTKDLQCMMTHALASTTLTDFPSVQVTSHVVGIFALHFVSPIQMLSLYQFIQFLTCTRIPCTDSHCEDGLVRCCLYTSPSVAADRRQL